MPNSKQANDVATYAAAVRSALASLPDAERASLLEDLENHLAEVAGESDLSLQERLGNPEDYAAELRSAYNSGGNTPNTKRRRPFRERSWALVKAAFGTQVYRELRALLPELLPGWWVLRAYLIVLVFAFIFRGDSNLRPIPNPFSSGGLLQILATLVAISISVRLGRRGMPVNRGWRGAVLAVNVGIALLALPVFVRMGTGGTYAYSYADTSDPYFSAVSAGYYPGLTNIYPYSKDGKALNDILLYDQDGHPLISSKGDLVTDVPTGADGLPIPNAYPLNQRDSNGLTVLPPRVALPPWQTSAPATSPMATPSP
jgi:Predicted membrane protein